MVAVDASDSPKKSSTSELDMITTSTATAEARSLSSAVVIGKGLDELIAAVLTAAAAATDCGDLGGMAARGR